MLTKRITSDRRVVSQFDPSYVRGFTPEQKEAYSSTLNIEELGKFDELKTKPTTFKVSPLKSKYEHMAYNDTPDYWGIFATHVKGWEYYNEVKFSSTNDIIDDDLRDELPPRIVQNIASMIIALANITGDDAFFLQSVGALRFNQQVLIRDAQKRTMSHALTGVAKTKASS